MDTREEVFEIISLADLVPIQENDPVSARMRMSGEFRLLWTVLEDGVDSYLRYATHPSPAMQELFREAEQWIESEDDEWLCSFVSLCRAFQIDPTYLRRGLRQRLQEIRREAAVLKRAA